MILKLHDLFATYLQHEPTNSTKDKKINQNKSERQRLISSCCCKNLAYSEKSPETLFRMLVALFQNLLHKVLDIFRIIGGFRINFIVIAF